MEREAWETILHGVAESRTGLSDQAQHKDENYTFYSLANVLKIRSLPCMPKINTLYANYISILKIRGGEKDQNQ